LELRRRELEEKRRNKSSGTARVLEGSEHNDVGRVEVKVGFGDFEYLEEEVKRRRGIVADRVWEIDNRVGKFCSVERRRGKVDDEVVRVVVLF